MKIHSLIIYTGLAISCLFFCAGIAHSQEYPTKPIHIVVGYTPGGGADGAARLAAQKLQESLKQSVIVDNRPGASGAIAIEAVARAPMDGYTLLLLTSANVAQAALTAKPTYDLERDFAPVTLLITGPYVLVVRPTLPARNVKELISIAREVPGKLNYGSSGVGGQAHFAGEMLSSMASIQMTHIPYKGSSEFVTATVGGQIDLSFPSVASAAPLIESGKLRALAVTSATRSTLLPDVPSLDESGIKGYDLAVWYGLLGPRGTPGSVISRLNETLGKSFSAQDVRTFLAKQGSEPRATTPQQFAEIIKKEFAQNLQLIKALNIKPE